MSNGKVALISKKFHEPRKDNETDEYEKNHHCRLKCGLSLAGNVGYGVYRGRDR